LKTKSQNTFWLICDKKRDKIENVQCISPKNRYFQMVSITRHMN